MAREAPSPWPSSLSPSCTSDSCTRMWFASSFNTEPGFSMAFFLRGGSSSRSASLEDEVLEGEAFLSLWEEGLFFFFLHFLFFSCSCKLFWAAANRTPLTVFFVALSGRIVAHNLEVGFLLHGLHWHWREPRAWVGAPPSEEWALGGPPRP